MPDPQPETGRRWGGPLSPKDGPWLPWKGPPPPKAEVIDDTELLRGAELALRVGVARLDAIEKELKPLRLLADKALALFDGLIDRNGTVMPVPVEKSAELDDFISALRALDPERFDTEPIPGTWGS